MLIRLCYDGSEFRGWQAQPNGRTVQQSVAEAAARVCDHPVAVRGASRTDAGVHALGQVAAFTTVRALSGQRWELALNRYLPDDVAVLRAASCPADYDPRFDAVDKTYRYLFDLGALRNPLLRRRVWHLGRHVRYDTPAGGSQQDATPRLDLPLMHRAAELLEGEHDFRAFRAADDTRDNTVRTLSRVALLERHRDDPRLLALEVTGTAFLKHMVRILAGTLVDVGRGVIPLPRLQTLLRGEAPRSQAGVTAPPQGLTLVRIRLGRSRGPASD